MKRKITLKEVWNYYGTTGITRTPEGFEIHDENRGITVVIPDEFYQFIDGGLIDPAMMLVDRMGWMRREMFRSLDLCVPVSMAYAFGRSVTVAGKEKFYVQDPMELTADSMDIMVEAAWDLRQGVSNRGWTTEVEKNWGGSIIYQKTVPMDIYETQGVQIWVLHIMSSMSEMMQLKDDFYTWQRQMIGYSDEVLRNFEVKKGEYQRKILEVANRLVEECDFLLMRDESNADVTAVAEITLLDGRKVLRQTTYRHDTVGLAGILEMLERELKLRRDEYVRKFKAVAPEIVRHAMEITTLENGKGVRIRKIQPPAKFLVGEFTFDEEGWRRLHEECSFLVKEE